VYTVPVTEASVNVEICPGDVNYIAYRADWLLGLYNDTKNRWAVYAIIAHEVGHYFLAHDRKAVGSNQTIELEADRYAGEVLAKMGVSLKDAQAAFRSSLMNSTDETHPRMRPRVRSKVRVMHTYSLDLRQKVVAAVERGDYHHRGCRRLLRRRPHLR
jgi:hypothetical protein